MPTPRTTATTITSRVAIRVIASVIIESFHSPVPKMIARQITVTDDRAPATEHVGQRHDDQAITHHGDSASRSCSGLMNHR